MKNTLAVLILFSTALSSIGQTLKITEPEFSGVILFVNDTIGSGIRLEQQVCSMQTKSNGAKAFIPFANVKVTSRNIVNGCCSTLKIDSAHKISFIVKVKDNSVDPSTLINIFKLVSEKDLRAVELSSVSTYGGAKAGEIKFYSFTGKKYGVSSYLIEINNLGRGEYAITLPERRDLFNMFSVR